MLITASSVDDLGNVSSASADGGPVRIRDTHGYFRVSPPRYGSPPYQVSASAVTKEGLRSPPTTIPVP
jgi:hypothetical protein